MSRKNPIKTEEPKYFSVENFRYDHAEALLSLDEKVIRNSCKKWGIMVSQNLDEFWASVHRAIDFMPIIPAEKKELSRAYLSEKKINKYSQIPLAL